MEAIAQLAAVMGVLGLAAGAAWWLRRRGFTSAVLPRGGAGKRLESISRLALGPQQMMHLVRLGDTAWLVASGPGGCTLLQTLPWAETQRARGVLS